MGKKSTKTVKNVLGVNVSDGLRYNYKPYMRCASDPSYLFASPNFTKEDAFDIDSIKTIADANEGDTIYVEWADTFAYVDERNGIAEVIEAGNVWRKTEIIEKQYNDIDV